MSEVRHVLGISGGKDSAALAIYLKINTPIFILSIIAATPNVSWMKPFSSLTGCALT